MATRGIEPVRLGRRDFAEAATLKRELDAVDTVVHVAGVNRAPDDEVESANVALAESLSKALAGRDVHLVFANSIHADGDSPYGRGKRQAAEILRARSATFADVLLPNLFGEHGRPQYNSFVATFSHEVASGRQPVVTADRNLPLLHAQDAAEHLVAAAETRQSATTRPEGQSYLISEVLRLLNRFHGLYGSRGELPDVSDPFVRDLFNTYRAVLFPGRYPMHTDVHADQRGELVEALRSHGGTGQAFVSSTVPGATRGDHYHLRKFERFMVVRGEAEIALRRLYHDEVTRFRVSGATPGYIDMPTMWTHNIRNVGDEDLITVFWADQLLDPTDPDQFPLKVEVQA
jgi:UDP-2-acetamido-2,6-beta-L-arabino-hexul-4-ose reductase